MSDPLSSGGETPLAELLTMPQIEYDLNLPQFTKQGDRQRIICYRLEIQALRAALARAVAGQQRAEQALSYIGDIAAQSERNSSTGGQSVGPSVYNMTPSTRIQIQRIVANALKGDQ